MMNQDREELLHLLFAVLVRLVPVFNHQPDLSMSPLKS